MFHGVIQKITVAQFFETRCNYVLLEFILRKEGSLNICKWHQNHTKTPELFVGGVFADTVYEKRGLERVR